MNRYDFPATPMSDVAAASWLTAVVESSDDAIIGVDFDCTILSWNRSAERIFGYTAEEMIGSAITRLIPADRRDEEGRMIRAIRRGETIDRFETKRLHRDGKAVDVSITACPIRGEKSEFIGMLTISRDNSLAKALETMEEFRILADAMPQIVWITDHEGANTFFNRRWTEYTGLTAKECAGAGWLKPFHPDDQAPSAAAWKRATTQNATYSIEVRLRRADGAYRWWLIRGAPHRDKNGKILKWFGTCTDIDDMKQAEIALERSVRERESLLEQLVQSQKMESVGRLAGGVAHDFNNILTAINGYAQLVLSTLPNEDFRTADLREVLTAGERASRLTNQLLAFSRKQIMAPRILDINAVVSGMIKMLERLIGENIKLRMPPSSGPIHVSADAGQLEQVVLNLAINARDAMPNGGELTFSTSTIDEENAASLARLGLPRGPLVLLTVKDTGVGMSDEVKSHIFEPFFTTKEKGKGTGLGLSTVYGIIKQMGGEIEVESAPGRGAAFRIYFPLADQSRPNDGKPADKSIVLRGTETILLVEDEGPVRRLLERAVASYGYRVFAAADGESALRLLEGRGTPFDLLITDVMMPGMSGRDLARAVAARNMARRTLYISGYAEDAIVADGVLESGLALLRKPFSPDALVRKMRDVLDGPADQARV
jgi:two-component system, cell cycle sensor histidine kinase and response regulator CckA